MWVQITLGLDGTQRIERQQLPDQDCPLCRLHGTGDGGLARLDDVPDALGA